MHPMSYRSKIIFSTFQLANEFPYRSSQMSFAHRMIYVAVLVHGDAIAILTTNDGYDSSKSTHNTTAKWNVCPISRVFDAAVSNSQCQVSIKCHFGSPFITCLFIHVCSNTLLFYLLNVSGKKRVHKIKWRIYSFVFMCESLRVGDGQVKINLFLFECHSNSIETIYRHS